MDLPYPEPPAGIPADLARPTKTYDRHAWAAVGALVAFVLLYLGLTWWFGRTAWRLASGALEADGNAFWGFALAIPAFFLFAFLVKGLFFVRKGQIGQAVEVKPEDEPALFAFLHRVADEAGAPRPHRVFLTPDVNASVFYDLSVRNLVWPSKKNLNIGLGLVNVLTLDELKAVLAHEFGHFAQRTMAVGTWVYVASHAIGAIVARRDGFDKFLDGLSRVDLRIAWIGWAMRLVVWSIRVVLDTAFRGLLVVQRALSREMEFQADLVSVSLCGSDSLVHALRRLGAADEAMTRAMAFASKEGRAGRPAADLYALQTQLLDRMRAVWNDPALGTVPPRPEEGGAAHRVFTRAIAEVPRMWATHPPSHEREENAKRVYVPSTLDARPAWAVFADPAATRRRMTAQLYAEHMPEAAQKPVAAEEETRARVDGAFARPCFAERHRGVYVGRSAVRAVRTYKELYDTIPVEPDAIRAALDATYPDGVVTTLRAAREAEEQVAQLEALVDGVLTAPGGVIQFRGRTLRRKELPAVLEEARAERDGLRASLVAHDRAVRTAHRAAARALGQGWEPHLVGLAAVLHYAEHLEADLADAQGALQNVLRIATADGEVSRAELERILAAGIDLQSSLATVYGHAKALRLPAPVLAKLEKESWEAVLGEELGLPPPTRETLASDWLSVAEGWVNAATACLDAVGSATLDVLLDAEAHVARCWRAGEDPGAAPEPPLVPVYYPTAAPGQERPRQKKLDWWDRFQTADGWLPGAARLGAASAILAPALFLTNDAGTATIVVHNGLAVPVEVDVGEVTGLTVGPHTDREVTVGTTADLVVEARAADGRVLEHFTADADHMWSTYVYNVASADVLAIVFVGYGTDRVPEPTMLGTERWTRSRADYTFEEPPRSIDAKAPTTKQQMVGLAGMSVAQVMALAPPEQRAGLARAHLRLDDVRVVSEWAHAAAGAGLDVVSSLDERATAAQDRVVIGRIRQDLDPASVCPTHAAAAAAAPDDADAVYLAIRCLPDAEVPAAVAAASARFPDHPWLGWLRAWEQMRAGDWAGADATLVSLAGALAPIEDQLIEARLRAIRNGGGALDAQLAMFGSDPRAVLLAAEAGQPGGDPSTVGPWEAPTVARARGDLVAAETRAAELEGEAAAWHRWMNAASEGAPPEALAAVSGLGAVGLDNRTLWVAMALHAREGRDLAPFLPRAEAAEDELRAVLVPVLTAPREGVAAAVEAAGGAGVYARAWARLVGVLRLGDEAPEAWRHDARATLLPWERPYLRPAGAVVAGE